MSRVRWYSHPHPNWYGLILCVRWAVHWISVDICARTLRSCPVRRTGRSMWFSAQPSENSPSEHRPSSHFESCCATRCPILDGAVLLGTTAPYLPPLMPAPPWPMFAHSKAVPNNILGKTHSLAAQPAHCLEHKNRAAGANKNPSSRCGANRTAYCEGIHFPFCGVCCGQGTGRGPSRFPRYTGGASGTMRSCPRSIP